MINFDTLCMLMLLTAIKSTELKVLCRAFTSHTRQKFDVDNFIEGRNLAFLLYVNLPEYI